MDYDGGFHEVETDGKLFLVYHHPKYRPIPQIKSTSSPDEAANQDHPPLSVFLCPVARAIKDYPHTSELWLVTSSPEYVISTTRAPDNHHILPLFWCNNKKFGNDGGCSICINSNFGTDYYFCDYSDLTFHKECVEAPLKIKHPYYPRNSLELCFHHDSNFDQCSCCGRKIGRLIYHCSVYQTSMHPICAMKSITVIIDQPKIDVHPLTFFPRQNYLICSVCGLLEKYATYVCLRCNFVAHRDCMYFPQTIKISRHHHRISHVSFLRDGKWPCGVCRQSIHNDYGAYTCNKCGDYYAVHSRCALGNDVWDGEELEGVQEKDEDDITQDAPPFCKISKGVVHYFLHDHHLQLEENILYDENKLCEACVMPVLEEKLYSCTECDFILHETCLKARRRIQHALHPHLLILKAINNGSGYFQCSACSRSCGGLVYQCPKEECEFELDVRCASISEPFNFQGHEHPLFLSLAPGKVVRCEVCKDTFSKSGLYNKLLNCIKCDFIMCIECATLPYKARYKNDKHFLTFSWREERCVKYWCEECEDIVDKLFYWCNDCCTILHTACLFSEDPYLKPGQSFETYGGKVQILAKSNTSRPICDYCMKPCQVKIFTIDNRTTCSMHCAI